MNKSNTTIKFILLSTCIYMLTTCCFYHANANPNRVRCDLKGTANDENVMTQDTIMHATPHEIVIEALRINRATIDAAALRIAPHIIETPLIESPRLNDKLGIRLLLKAECLQHTGSFKLRGASNAVWSLDNTVTDLWIRNLTRCSLKAWFAVDDEQCTEANLSTL